MKQGDAVACDECRRARPIETAVIELFGFEVGYGPGGEEDMFLERDGKIRCYSCSERELTENYE